LSPEQEHHPQIIQVAADSVAKRAAVILQAVAAIGAIVALVLVVLTSRNESRDAKRQATANAVLLRRIQQSRFEAAFNTCMQSNNRHDATVRSLTVVFAAEFKHPPKGTTEKALHQNLDQNLFLINAFVPRFVAGTGTLKAREHRACTERADAQTQERHPA